MRDTEKIYRTALVYAQYTGLSWDVDEPETVISDMIADLLHLADEYGVDVDAALAHGSRYYVAETEVK